MQVNLESSEGLKRTLKITVPAEQHQAAKTARLKEIAKKVKIDGFRPGKVPAKVVEQQYGGQAAYEATYEVVEETWAKAVEDQDLNVAGYPSVESTDEGEDEFSYTAVVEVYPEVELMDFAKIEVEKATAEIGDADVENLIETLRKQRTVFETVDKAAEEGDQVTLDFTGRLDGEEFEGGKAQGHQFVLGQQQMIQEFEAAVTGMKAGENKTAKVTFPEDYNAEHLAGKATEFDLNVTTVAAPKLPEVDEAFIKEFGVDGGVDAFKADIKNNMVRELEQTIEGRLKDAVMTQLVELHDFDLPSNIVAEESKVVRTNRVNSLMEQMGGQQKIEEDQFPLDMFEDEAKRRVKLGLIVAEIVKAHNIEQTDESINAVLENLAASYEDKQEVIDYYKSQPQMMQNVATMAIEKQVMDKVLESAKVTEVKKAFDEVMQSQPSVA